MDIKEKKYLETIQEFVENKDFKSASRENQRLLKYLSENADMTEMVSLNSIKSARTTSHLLTRIMADAKNKQTLSAKIQSDEKQIKSLNLMIDVLKQTAAAQQKKIVEMNRLLERIKILESEKELLQQQMDRLKEIDLTQN